VSWALWWSWYSFSGGRVTSSRQPEMPLRSSSVSRQTPAPQPPEALAQSPAPDPAQPPLVLREQPKRPRQHRPSPVVLRRLPCLRTPRVRQRRSAAETRSAGAGALSARSARTAHESRAAARSARRRSCSVGNGLRTEKWAASPSSSAAGRAGRRSGLGAGRGRDGRSGRWQRARVHRSSLGRGPPGLGGMRACPGQIGARPPRSVARALETPRTLRRPPPGTRPLGTRAVL
jgi:hypothetical protein